MSSKPSRTKKSFTCNQSIYYLPDEMDAAGHLAIRAFAASLRPLEAFMSAVLSAEKFRLDNFNESSLGSASSILYISTLKDFSVLPTLIYNYSFDYFGVGQMRCPSKISGVASSFIIVAHVNIQFIYHKRTKPVDIIIQK